MHEPNITPWCYKPFVSIQYSCRTKSNLHLIWYACHSQQHNHKRSRISLSTSKALLFIQQLVISTPRYKYLLWSQRYAIFTPSRFLNVKMSLPFKASGALFTHSNPYKQHPKNKLRVSQSPPVKNGCAQCWRWTSWYGNLLAIGSTYLWGKKKGTEGGGGLERSKFNYYIMHSEQIYLSHHCKMIYQWLVK